MSEVMNISIKNNQKEFFPGDEIAGFVEVTPQEVEGEIQANLLYGTQGLGVQDIVSVAVENLTLRGDKAKFYFLLPSAPWSCRGSYLSLSWFIEVSHRSIKEPVKYTFTLSDTGKVKDIS